MSFDNFPKYNSKRKIADAGVTIVRTLVENEFEWIFRPTHLEDDFGIDGFFDIIGIDNSVTGKYLGVQIKTGLSYFNSKTSFGWKFNGEIKHLNYYLNLDYPILILLVNPDTKEIFWAEFDINKTEKTSSGWSTIVPFINLLTKNVKKEIASFAGDTIDYMSQIEYQWEENNQLKESELILLNVSKTEVLNKDVSGFTKLLERLTVSDEMIEKTLGKFTFFIDGYNNDEREAYSIPEVREWIKIVLPAFKYWGYFLNMEHPFSKIAGLKFIQFAYAEIKILGKSEDKTIVNVSVSTKDSADLLLLMFEWLNEFTDKYKISEKVNENRSKLIGDILLDR